MSDTSKYMNILAKVMQSNSSLNHTVIKEKYNKIYYKIYSDLHSKLQNSSYPFTSDIVQKCENMLVDMEQLIICPELMGKRCVLISDDTTTNVFKIYNEFFYDKNLTSRLRTIYTKIPLIIINSEDENVIEILNYANVRIKLTIDELEFLVNESKKRKIDLNKIVQYIFVKTKVSKEDICIISDNIYSFAEKRLRRVLSKKIVHTDNEVIKRIEKGYFKNFSILLMDKTTMAANYKNQHIMKYDIITYDKLDSYIDSNIMEVLYGFMDEFRAINIQILDYYDKQTAQSRITTREVVEDIVRLGDTLNSQLKELKEKEQNKDKKLRNEHKEILIILKEIEDMMLDICDDLGENHISNKQINRTILDNLFEGFFRCTTYKEGNGQLLLSRLYSFEYDNYDLVSTYVQFVSGKKKTYEPIEIEKYEWEKAKMLIAILDPDKIPKDIKKMYIGALRNRCTSGKELFVKALISPPNLEIKLLKESFDKGYDKAGLLLLEKYQNGEGNISIMPLVNALVPEACMVLADEKMENYKNRRKFVNLSDKEFAYYKIAATRQYAPAIGKIVDIVFESRFSSGFQIPKDDLYNKKYSGMIELGEVLCKLCNFLINKRYQVSHYNEVLGIVLFSLNEDLSGAISLLNRSGSALAYYCKGNMYEFGGGVSIDLEKAIRNYKKAVAGGFGEKAKKRLLKCEDKQEMNNYDYYDYDYDDYYDSDKDYTPSVQKTKSTSNDSCFAPGTHILMSNGQVKCVENIEVGDKVLVFDHYKGNVCEDVIVANVHEISNEKMHSNIYLNFEDDVTLGIVKSHGLFDLTENKYILLDENNVNNYVGHRFAVLKNGNIEECKLLSYSVENKKTYFYMPVSRYHLNVFAEGILTIPPTYLTINLFNILTDMRYDLSVVDKIGKTSYEYLKDIISYEEYSDLPFEYFASVIHLKKCSFDEFEEIMTLYRQQKKYIKE